MTTLLEILKDINDEELIQRVNELAAYLYKYKDGGDKAGIGNLPYESVEINKHYNSIAFRLILMGYRK